MSNNHLTQAQNAGWVTSTTPPAYPNPQAGMLLSKNAKAIAIDATELTASVWTDHIPTSSEILTWERSCGRLVNITVTTSEVLAGLLSLTKRNPNVGFTKVLNDLTTLNKSEADDVFPTVTGMLLRAGHAPTITTPVGVRDLANKLNVYTSDDIENIKNDLGLTEKNITTTTLSTTARIRITSIDEKTIIIKLIPLTPPSTNQAWLPDTATRLCQPGAGVVIVGGGANSGKSSLAWALAAHAVAHRGGLSAVLANQPDWTSGGPTTIVNTIDNDLTKQLTTLATAGVQTFVIDVANVTPQIVWQAASAGALLFVIVTATSTATALTMLSENINTEIVGTLFRGSIIRWLLPSADKENVLTPVDETILSTGTVKATIKTGKYTQIPAALDIDGRNSGVTIDTALARAISSGRIRADVAIPLVNDITRFNAAAGRLTEMNAIEPVEKLGADDWNWNV